jgi:microcystin-dependent protein
MPTTISPQPQAIVLSLPESKGDKGDKGDQGIQGIQGNPGQPANWRGTWNSSTTYVLNDGIYYNGNSYIAIAGNLNKPPDVNPGFWQQVGAQGLQGIQGVQGIQGIQGVNAFTTTAVDFTVPNVGFTAPCTVVDASWVVPGQYIWLAGAAGSGIGGSLQVQSKSGNSLTLLNPAPLPGIAVGGTVVVSGSLLSSGGATGSKGDSLPIGSIFMFGAMTPPAGCLLCDGSAVSRSTYSTLFGIFGTSFGAGNGSSTFNLPDLQGRFPLGAGAGAGLTSRALASKGGEETHALVTGELAAHTHAGVNSHTHPFTGVDHLHSMQNHTHAGVNHLHGMDHYHSIPTGQFSHTHGVSSGVVGGNNPVQGLGAGSFTYYRPEGIAIAAATLPVGNTAYASQTNSGWVNTTGADRDLTTGGPSVASTGATDRSLAGTTGASNQDLTSGSAGSGTAHNNMPPFLTIAFMVKAS